ncbi:hypothetical protein ELI24_39190 [Rhizobium ruizarguesonis]|uniref:hypothetical protein n=1 Tax=Rhizobium ruizarguesonis TaxID=2081791 RepID=UPI001030A624|nr:hypothetical protein [Rhizobium ruizarguesonis]TAV82649.1 hypothetical protein ELI24_39190 [Rhizobium ruizarguesonis]TAZ43540.1 hypothetical protein ELH76_37685 [Rhizobium ruizarguesonis]
MKTKTKIFKGLTFDILVEEAEATDGQGGRLWYLARIYVRERGTSERHLVQKSRLPGTADKLAAEIRQHGIRVFDSYKSTRPTAATEAARPAPATRPGLPQQRQPVASRRAPAP